MRFVNVATAAVVAVILVAGCGGDDDGSDAADVLVPADEAVEAGERDDATTASLGDTVELVDGLSVTVNTVEVSDREPYDDERAQLEVELRVENRSDEEMSPPETLVSCGDGESGAWYADSTFDQTGTMPPGTFVEGTLILGVPTDCGDPVLRTSPVWVMDSDAVTVIWDVPADVFE